MEHFDRTTIAAAYASLAANAALAGRTAEAVLYGLIALIYGSSPPAPPPPTA